MPKLAPVPLLVTLLVGCPASAAAPAFELEVVGTSAMAQLDSLPEPVVEVREGRLVIVARFGLGATGYQLSPHGTLDEGVVDLLVAAEMPADMAGLQVLTAYEYRLTTPVLAPGTWRLRLHHAIADEGDPEFILEREVVVPR